MFTFITYGHYKDNSISKKHALFMLLATIPVDVFLILYYAGM